MDYQFQNVTELILIIDRRWRFGFIEHLSTMVNLSNLQTLAFDFQSECKFDTNFTDEMNTLFRHVCNLRSIKISCHDSERIKLITLNAICLKLPRCIRHLDTAITHVEDATLILERGVNLSKATFRIVDDYKSFVRKIKERLSYMGRNLVVTRMYDSYSDSILDSDSDWDMNLFSSLYSNSDSDSNSDSNSDSEADSDLEADWNSNTKSAVHIWLSKDKCQQSNAFANHKRFKRNHYTHLS